MLSTCRRLTAHFAVLLSAVLQRNRGGKFKYMRVQEQLCGAGPTVDAVKQASVEEVLVCHFENEPPMPENKVQVWGNPR